MNTDWIAPQWNAPARVRAISTTRRGGFSAAPWNSMNLGASCGDEVSAILRNRALLRSCLPADPVWLRQEHGTRVFCHPATGIAAPTSAAILAAAEIVADAQLATRPGQVCAVLSADCLPVLFCNRAGTRVAAAHAGWRGLLAGVLEQTVQSLGCAPDALLAWLGPAIGPDAFVVGDEVRTAFVAGNEEASMAFAPQGERWLCDLYALARQRLARVGVGEISGGGYCTYGEPERFFSYRRDKVTGRMATLVWLDS
jgi:polyphenol oxidase